MGGGVVVVVLEVGTNEDELPDEVGLVDELVDEDVTEATEKVGLNIEELETVETITN